MPQIGEKIPVKPEVKELLATLNEQRKQAEMGFRAACRWLTEEEKKFWKVIHEAHPELAGCDLMYNSATGEIRIVSVKSDDE